MYLAWLSLLARAESEPKHAWQEPARLQPGSALWLLLHFAKWAPRPRGTNLFSEMDKQEPWWMKGWKMRRLLFCICVYNTSFINSQKVQLWKEKLSLARALLCFLWFFLLVAPSKSSKWKRARVRNKKKQLFFSPRTPFPPFLLPCLLAALCYF